MSKKSASRVHTMRTAVCCLSVLCISLMLCFGVLMINFSQSPLFFSMQLGSFDPVIHAGARGLALLAILVVFSCVVVMLPPLMATAILLLSGVIIGVVYQTVPRAPTDPKMLAALVALLAVYSCYLACGLWHRFSKRRKVSQFFEHHVPSTLTNYYIDNPEGMQAVSDSRELTILFCDIKRFTGVAELLDPDSLREWLNAYFGVVSQVIHQHGGTVDKYMGDSVMAFWGAPQSSETHAIDALFASRKIQQEVAVLSRKMQSMGMPPINIGIGVSTGFANVGHMGSRHHMTYTAVGDPVNTANRLQRCTGYYDMAVVVSESTVDKVPQYLFRELDTVHVKGRQRIVRLFEPVCPADEASPELLKRLQLHRKAMQFYRRGMWSDAERLFVRLKRDGLVDDGLYRKYIDRIQEIKTNRPKDETAHILDLTQQIG